MASSSTGRLYSLDEVVADMDGMMDIPGPAADDDEWSDDGYVDTNQQRGETESGVNIDELGIGGECEVGEAAAESDIPEYSLSVGCNYSCNDATPLELFKMLLTDDILDKIVEQTNLYARQYITSHDLSPRSRVHGWSREPFTREELLKFISLIIVMGLVNLPTLEDHWMTTWPYSSQTCTKVCNNNRESIATGIYWQCMFNVLGMSLAICLRIPVYIKLYTHTHITTGPKTRSIQFHSQIPPPQRQHSLHSERAARS